MNPNLYYIIAPCYNEGEVIVSFLDELCKVLENAGNRFVIILVDDASQDQTLEKIRQYEARSSNISMRAISLEYNLGHQSAIYQGILYADQLEAGCGYIVMDSDGEDDPAAIPQLIMMAEAAEVVHVVRGRRSEGFLFILLYRLYRFFFRLVTGKTMNYGNYSLLSKKALHTLARTSFYHFAAALSKLRLKSSCLKSDRKKRIDGKSKMSFSALANHAFRSFVEHAESLLMVFLKLFMVTALAMVLLAGNVLYQKLFTDHAILGWASTLSATLFAIALISLGFFTIGLLLLNISSRYSPHFKEPLYRIVVD